MAASSFHSTAARIMVDLAAAVTADLAVTAGALGVLKCHGMCGAVGQCAVALCFYVAVLSTDENLVGI